MGVAEYTRTKAVATNDTGSSGATASGTDALVSFGAAKNVAGILGVGHWRRDDYRSDIKDWNEAFFWRLN